MEMIVGPPTGTSMMLREYFRFCFLVLKKCTRLTCVCFVFFSPSADDRPIGKSPVGTVQEPPSKLPGKTSAVSARRFSSDRSLVSIQDDFLSVRGQLLVYLP